MIIPLCYTEHIMVNQKVLVTLIVCIGIIGAVFVISKKDSVKTTGAEIKNQNLLATIDKTSDMDSDGDGLKDWEEQLIGTNPKNKDTDGDGTSDGDEISQNRDPKKAGPNDKNSTESLITGATQLNTSATTLTEQVSKEFFSRYIAAKQQNSNFTQKDAVTIAQSVIQNVYVAPTLRIYTKSDIYTTNDVSAESKKRYAQALADAINKNSPKNSGSELILFAQALQDQKESDLIKLDVIIKGYKGLVADTVKITVPLNAVADHLIYLNTLSAIQDDITNMRLILTDPIKAYAAFSNYQRDTIKLKIAFENLEKYFAQ